MKKPTNMKISLISVLFFIAGLVSAQEVCVKRVSRYIQAPSIVTIYRCTSITTLTDKSNVEYNMSILVDSIYLSERIYRLTCEFNKPVKLPCFHVYLNDGEMISVYPSDIAPDGLSFEAPLTREEKDLFLNNVVSGLTVWHQDLKFNYNPRTPCKDYFKDFITKYENPLK